MQQRAVDALGQRRVLVAGEAGERAAGDLQQPQVLAAAAVVADAVGVELDHRDRVVAAGLAREQLAAEAVEAVLAARHPHRLHHRVGGEEAAPEVQQQALERVAVVGQRLAQDEVLHRVRGHHVGVVALGVGGREVLAEHLDADLAGEHVVVAVRALDDALERDAQLAVGDLHAGSASSRWWAIRAISAERGAQLRLGVVAHALLRGRQDRVLVVVADADHEREAEPLAVGGVGARERLVLLAA